MEVINDKKDFFKCMHCDRGYQDGHCYIPSCWDGHREWEGNLDCPYFEPNEDTKRVLSEIGKKGDASKGKHLTQDTVVLRNGKQIRVLNRDTCEYILDVMYELAEEYPSDEPVTFSTPVGRITFEIGF